MTVIFTCKIQWNEIWNNRICLNWLRLQCKCCTLVKQDKEMVKRELIVKEKCLMFHQISFRKLLGRGSFGLLGLCCCPHNLVPDKRIKMDRGRLKPTPFRLVFCFPYVHFYCNSEHFACYDSLQNCKWWPKSKIKHNYAKIFKNTFFCETLVQTIYA